MFEKALEQIDQERKAKIMAKKEQKFWQVEVEKVVRGTVWVKSTDEKSAVTAALKKIHAEDEDAWKYDDVQVGDVSEFIPTAFQETSMTLPNIPSVKTE